MTWECLYVVVYAITEAISSRFAAFLATAEKIVTKLSQVNWAVQHKSPAAHTQENELKDGAARTI